MTTQTWIPLLADQLPPSTLAWDLPSRLKASTDYAWFSPVLWERLRDRVADAVVTPTTEEELDIAVGFAVEHRIPLTVRGGGTGNYGQAVPLAGGLVLDMSRLDRVLEIIPGSIRCQAGARLGTLEKISREHGQELRMFPSTYKKATIGGFVQGGSGGIGSITWGTLWDDLVSSVRGKTATQPVETFEAQDAAVMPYLHSYGLLGIVTELTVRLAPKTDWDQWVISFDRFETALRFAQAIAENTTLAKRLISLHESPIAGYFTPLYLDSARSVVLLEIAADHRQPFEAEVKRAGGHVAIHWESQRYHHGVGISDFSWNHTTLWARKFSPQMTYLQARFDWHRVHEQIALLKRQYPEVLIHLEMMKSDGQLMASGLPLLPFVDEGRLNRIIQFCRDQGIGIANPHTWLLDEGGRTPPWDLFWHIKQQHDPFHLLNPGKVGPLSTSVTAG